MQVPDDIVAFIKAVGHLCDVDAPIRNPTGIWYLDFDAAPVSWSEKQGGFGLHGRWDKLYGPKAKKIEADPAKAAELYLEMTNA